MKSRDYENRFDWNRNIKREFVIIEFDLRLLERMMPWI